MIKNCQSKAYKCFLYVAILFVIFYGLGRLYYYTTGGFTLGNITYELAYNPRWEIPSLSSDKKNEIDQILNQNFYYLGKGCQSYVFESEDSKYVLKFIKYQRFRPKPWLDYLTFIPFMNQHLQDKIETKREKLHGVFTSWKIAYENLQKETGVLYIHLNKSKTLNKTLTLFDKMGFKHTLDLDNYEFLVQLKADMLCSTLNKWMAEGEIESSQELITQLIKRIISEYERGYADNDHALMQNTGVLDLQPVHVDVGQFVKNNRVQDVSVRNQELFNKTWKFRIWLENQHPILAEHIANVLRDFMGEEQFSLLTPRLNKAEMGILAHQSEEL